MDELERYAILGTAPEASFDRFTRLASRLFRCPIALLSFVAPDKQWFKSCVGLPVVETSRDVSFCAWAIFLDQVLVVPDATKDPRFADNALVTAPDGIRFYAGAPIVSARGYNLGTFCVIDTRPRTEGLEVDEIETLKDLSAMVSSELEARLMADELRASHEARRIDDQRLSLLSAIVDSSDDAIISKSLDGIITSWNKSAERVFGYTSEETIGKPITMLIPPDRLGEEPEILARLRRGERVDHIETLRMRKDGSLLDISLTISPVRDRAGNVVGASKIARDITDSKRIMSELQRVNELLEQFAYSASHDLQEPLRTVKVFAELLTRNHSEELDPEGLKMLEMLLGGANRMEVLLRDLLAYTHVTKFEKPNEKSDANLAFESALQNLGNSISDSNAVVTAGRLPLVRVHFAHLQQLFQNLVGNAVKYREPRRPPVICVGVRRNISQWEFSVRDNGIGIEPQFAQTVFGLFKRLHRGEYPGTGLGLAICQRIVEQYGGRIWVESGLSEGSEFKFTIPD
jgi:PAS domain S-box-containing protein